MTGAQLWQLVQNPPVAIAMLTATALVLLTVVWVVRRAWSVLHGGRPDEPLSNLGMVIGFGWSSEAVWLLTGPGGADLLTPIRWALFCVFEVILIVFMIRAKRNVRLLGHPGRAGRATWVVATGMSLVAVWTAHNAGEAFLRVLVPLLLTAMWWDGLVGEGSARREDATSWRWTPRRLLLWLGAIEPGERDVESVHRERLTQQMTQLEFRRRHGDEKQQKRAARRLARLSLTADDEVVAAVRRRVDRAAWFEPTQLTPAPTAAKASISAAAAASLKSRRVRHRRSLRTLRVTQPQPVAVAAQEVRQEVRETQEVDQVVRVIREAFPNLPQRQIARLAATSEATARRALRRTRSPVLTPAVNGREPELTDGRR
jgi:hypothetical protein